MRGLPAASAAVLIFDGSLDSRVLRPHGDSDMDVWPSSASRPYLNLAKGDPHPAAHWKSRGPL